MNRRYFLALPAALAFSPKPRADFKKYGVKEGDVLTISSAGAMTITLPNTWPAGIVFVFKQATGVWKRA